MLSKRTVQELLQAAQRHPAGLVVKEAQTPRFVILGYEQYQQMSKPKAKKQHVVPSKKVLITGGAGYIGSHTARLLMERGFEVTTLDNLSTGQREFAQGQFIEGDIGDEHLLEKIFTEQKFDAVMHFAASIEVEESVHDPLKYYRNNVINGLRLLEAAVRHGAQVFVFSSSCAVYAEGVLTPIDETARTEPTSPYGETKLIFENILKWCGPAYGLSSVSLRYFNAAGASLDGALGLANPVSTLLIPNALNVALGKQEVLKVNGNDYSTPDGTAIRDYIHVLDLAEAHRRALIYLFERGGQPPIAEVFNVGTGRGYSVLEIVNAVCDVTGKMVRFEVGPRRAGDREKVIADAAKIKKVLSFEAHYSDLKTIIQTAWQWHQKRFG